MKFYMHDLKYNINNPFFQPHNSINENRNLSNRNTIYWDGLRVHVLYQVD